MKKTTLSVAIATHNEEKNIAKCLNAVKSWVDEIVIVDGQSSDKTTQIVKKYPKVRLISTTNSEQLHESWCAAKVRDGWIYGDVKDAEARTHPCLVAGPRRLDLRRRERR